MSYVRTTFVYAFTTRCDARVCSHKHFAHSWAAPARPLFVLSALDSGLLTHLHAKAHAARAAEDGVTGRHKNS